MLPRRPAACSFLSLGGVTRGQLSFVDLAPLGRHSRHPFSAAAASKTSPRAEYRRLVASGNLREDAAQMKVLDVMEQLHSGLSRHLVTPVRPLPKPRKGLEPATVASPPEPPVAAVETWVEAPKGLYLHGEVGTGKTCLMDIFFSTLDTPRKKRMHYSDFLADVRARLHRWTQLHRGSPEDYDPMLSICHQIASEASVLYIDELNDVVDISFLSRLIPELLLRHGCVLLATSNRHPSDLCDSVPLLVRVGQPVAELLKLRCHAEALRSIDYRRAMPKLHEKPYLVPLSAQNEAALEARFQRDIAPAKTESIDVRVDEFRLYPVKRSARGIARFSFEELFGRVSSAADFSALASTFHSFYVSGLRRMGIKDRAVVRRLILFIDALYEHRCKLFCTAEAVPEALFTGDAKSHDANIQELELLDDLSNQLYVAVPPWNNQREKIYSVLVTAEEEMFMFKRAVSRLEEMQSESYAARKHRPEGSSEHE